MNRQERWLEKQPERNNTHLFGGKASTFYISNIPEKCSEADLWKIFLKFGKLVDIYIARKMNRQGKRFGFARYLGVTNCISFAGVLRSATVDGVQLRCCVAKYERKADSSLGKLSKTSKAIENRSFIKPGQSFREVLNGKTKLENQNKLPKGGSQEITKMETAYGTSNWMNSSLIGRVSSLEKLWSVSDLMQAEGCMDIQIRFLGGFYVLLEFESADLAKSFIENSRTTWESWFESLNCWDKSFIVNERLASIIIQGLPPYAWSPDAFSLIARRFGEVIRQEECSEDNRNLSMGMVGILTSKLDWINEIIKVEVDGSIFSVRVIEDIHDSVGLIPSRILDEADVKSSDSDSDFITSDFGDDTGIYIAGDKRTQLSYRRQR